MDRRILVPGESDEADLSFLLRLIQGLDDAALGEVEFRIVLVDDLVDLPEIQVIRPEALQRFLELPHGGLPIPSVGANLGHQEDVGTPALQAPPHPFLAAAT